MSEAQRNECPLDRLVIPRLLHGDCLELMGDIESGSVDLILCDLPYGITACKWDSVIPFEPLWAHYKRIIKQEGAIVLFGSQPFTSALIMSNPKMFKYEWIWEKAVGSNFATVKYQPLKEHENVLVFSKNKHNYYPIKEPRKGSGVKRLEHGYKSNGKVSEVTGVVPNRKGKIYDELKNPSSVQYFNNRESTRGLHPTQKPVLLCEYLIQTYTNEGDTVLDNCMGSGSTIVAARNLNRRAIGIEKDAGYFKIASERIGV